MLAKESDDFSRVVTAFFLKLAGIWPACNPTEERQRRKAFMLTMTFMSFGTCVVCRELYYSYGVLFEEFVFSLCNIVTATLVFSKLITVFLRKPQFFKLIAYMEKRFWHTNYDSYEQALLDKCKQLSVVFICSFNFFAQGTAFSYSLESSVEYFSATNVTTRSLVFNLYTDVVMKPFIFEIILLLQYFVLVACGIGYICVDNFICISNFHVATQFRILQYRILNVHKRTQTELGIGTPSKLSADRADYYYTVFKDCIRQHQALIRYCEDMEEVFTIAALAQILLFSVLICLDGYLMLLGESSPYRRLSFTFHLIGTMCQLWMFTYSCDCVLQESMRIADTVYETIWKNLPMNTSGKMFRTDLQVVMIRSRVPCCLTASGFFIVSLETYTKVLSTAASYFTLLRQY